MKGLPTIAVVSAEYLLALVDRGGSVIRGGNTERKSVEDRIKTR